jgi:hypothetical protein
MLQSFISSLFISSLVIPLTYPLEIARIRLAKDMGGPYSRTFLNFSDCIKKILRQEGGRGLFRGITTYLTVNLGINLIVVGSFRMAREK